jgi:hypothetical protein
MNDYDIDCCLTSVKGRQQQIQINCLPVHTQVEVDKTVSKAGRRTLVQVKEPLRYPPFYKPTFSGLSQRLLAEHRHRQKKTQTDMVSSDNGLPAVSACEKHESEPCQSKTDLPALDLDPRTPTHSMSAQLQDNVKCAATMLLPGTDGNPRKQKPLIHATVLRYHPKRAAQYKLSQFAKRTASIEDLNPSITSIKRRHFHRLKPSAIGLR